MILFDVFALSFWYISLKHLDSWVVSSLRAMGPVIAAPYAYFVFNQSLSLFQIIGAVLVLLTSGLIVVAHGREQKK